MAEPKRSLDRRAPFALEILTGAAAAIVGGAIWYFLIGLLHWYPPLKDSRVVTYVQWGFGILTGITLVGSLAADYRRKYAATKTLEEIGAALDQLTRDGTKNVADVSAKEVRASLKGLKVTDEHFERLFAQGQQQALIDEKSFRDQVNALIVDYLQPLPRAAKRFVNRLRVNLLIAHNRGLLTTEPRLTAQHFGKWLVLSERWPQLSRSLTADPEKMADLESSATVKPSKKRRRDAFMALINVMAPAYRGDEDLRRFMTSEPAIAHLLPRLVHYGDPCAPAAASPAPASNDAA